MKNIVFDLGGVVFARDPRNHSRDFIELFSFIRDEKMPAFWEDYDRGIVSREQVVSELSRIKGREERQVTDYLTEALEQQREIPCTVSLVRDLKQRGYPLYVLSNMSLEFILHLRRMPVYACFDGEVVSCEEGVVKPEPEIYRLLIDRYRLDPAETLFIDDRPANLVAAREQGIDTFLFDHCRPDESCAALRKMLL